MIGRSNVSGGGSVEVFMGEATFPKFSCSDGSSVGISVDVDLPFVPTKIICYKDRLLSSETINSQYDGYFYNKISHFLATNQGHCLYSNNTSQGNVVEIYVNSVTKNKINFLVYTYGSYCSVYNGGSFTFKFIAIKE